MQNPNKVKTTELSKLAESFEFALARHVRQDPTIALKLRESFTPEEAREIDMLTTTITDTIGLMEALEVRPEIMNQRLAPMMILLIDKALTVPLRVLGDDTIADLVNPEDKSEENSQGFLAEGAPNLARVYAPKPRKP